MEIFCNNINKAMDEVPDLKILFETLAGVGND